MIGVKDGCSFDRGQPPSVARNIIITWFYLMEDGSPGPPWQLSFDVALLWGSSFSHCFRRSMTSDHSGWVRDTNVVCCCEQTWWPLWLLADFLAKGRIEPSSVVWSCASDVLSMVPRMQRRLWSSTAVSLHRILCVMTDFVKMSWHVKVHKLLVMTLIIVQLLVKR